MINFHGVLRLHGGAPDGGSFFSLRAPRRPIVLGTRAWVLRLIFFITIFFAIAIVFIDVVVVATICSGICSTVVIGATFDVFVVVGIVVFVVIVAAVVTLVAGRTLCPSWLQT